MAQASGNVGNDTFPNVRAEINDNLAALFSTSSGPSAPAAETTVPHQLWVDTSTDPPVLKIRDDVSTTLFHPVGVLDPGGFTPSGVTPIANGGTGQNTVAAAIAALLPSQTGNADKALLTNGTSLLWGAITASSFTKYTFAAGTGVGSTRTHLWTKPSSGSTAVVLIWGGGGAGGADNNEGGGGGAGSNCGFGLFPLSDLGSTETITLGQGGQGTTSDVNAADNGTNSTFGSHVTSYGGRGGNDDDGKTAFGSTPFGRGTLGTSLPISSEPFVIFSGGNGGTQGNTGTAGLGSNAIFGGAGGGSSASDKAGGTSLIAGNGGAGRDAASTAFDGSTPGGGGGGAQSGKAGNGGDGECWVLIF